MISVQKKLEQIDLQRLVDHVIRIAQDAGKTILNHYRHSAQADIIRKKDQSPLTNADLDAHRCISRRLAELTPDWPLLSEESESVHLPDCSRWRRFWLVDPLDGTREFLKKTDEFTVNIALIDAGKVVLGVVHAPVPGECYFATRGGGSFLSVHSRKPQKIHTRRWLGKDLRVLVSRSHPSPHIRQFIDHLPWPINTVPVGSSLKLCLLARGMADIYPRLSPTSLWDIAAADCVLVNAGGAILDYKGDALRYFPSENILNPKFIAIGDPDIPVHSYFQNVAEVASKA